MNQWQISLVDMVDYQKDAVSVRLLWRKAPGRSRCSPLTRSGLSEHTAPFDALVQVLTERWEISISGKPFHLKQGGIIVMPLMNRMP